MVGVPNVKTFTVSPWSESLNVVYGLPRRDVRLLISSAAPVTVTVFWSKLAGLCAISPTVIPRAAEATERATATDTTKARARVYRNPFIR